MNKFFFAIFALIALALLFICVDCSMGDSRHWECTVSDRRYVAQWTEFTTSNGKTDTVHHPEEFHVICRELNGAQAFDVNTTSVIYGTHTNGQFVTVKTRQGRWLKAQYVPRIVD